MPNQIPGWLKQVQAEQDRLPIWLKNVLSHPQFGGLNRKQADGVGAADSWWVATLDDQMFEGSTLGAACGKFTSHYRLTGNPPKDEAPNQEVRDYIRDLENGLVEKGSIVEWIQDVLEGKEVSDFAESFGVVRLVMDVVEQKKALEVQLADQDK